VLRRSRGCRRRRQKEGGREGRKEGGGKEGGREGGKEGGREGGRTYGNWVVDPRFVDRVDVAAVGRRRDEEGAEHAD